MRSDTADGTTGVIVESEQRLSSSLLWRLQRSYYERMGPTAWNTGQVPHYVVSNPHVARAYTRVIMGFLRDWHAASLGHPVHLVELGCGSGRFGYHLLSRLLRSLRASSLERAPVRYLMTDFTEANLTPLRAHPRLRPFVAAGLLDFAVVEAETLGTLRLLESGEVLRPRELGAPLVVIANYFFDSLPQDAFTVAGGRISECLVTLGAEQPIDLAAPDALMRLAVRHSERALAGPDYYDEPGWNQLLAEYASSLAKATLSFPCAALRCLGALAALADDHLLVLAADKGATRLAALEGAGGPFITTHGSISMAVNLHAIGRWFEQRGGLALHSAHQHGSFAVSAFALGRPPGGHEETTLAYREFIETEGPDDFYALKRGLERYGELSAQQLLALLRWSDWDAKLCQDMLPALMRHGRAAEPSLRVDLRQALLSVWDGYFPIGERQDLAFELATLLYRLDYPGDALELFTASLASHGEEAATLLNIGLCQERLGHRDQAAASAARALALDPELERAHELAALLRE